MTERKEIQGFDISDSSAAIIGCGGLGCNIAVHLAGAGIGTLYVCDFDKISRTNLNRQFLYTENDIGKSKVLCIEKRLKEYNSDIKIISINKKISNTNDLDFAKKCDLVFLAADNNQTRKTAADFCTLHRIPLINGGIDGFFGTAYLYVPEKSPCPECAGILTNASANLKSVSMTVGIIGALEANLGVKYLLNPYEETGGVLYIYDNGSITKLRIKSNPDCGICS